MPLDPSFIGKRYPPSESYLVSREKIVEFADAVGDPNPAYRNADAARALGHPDVVAPPTFLVVLTMRASAQVVFDPELGLDYSMVVHGEQSFTYERPVHARDELVVVGSVDNIRSVAGNDLLSLRGEVSTTAGELVCTARSTIVSRGTAAQEG